MIDNDKINIRVELSKDKNTGKLSIAVRFDTKAPNVSFEKNEYIWIPTLAEKELLNEAFRLLSDTKSLVSAQPKSTIETNENKKTIQPNKTEFKKEDNFDIKVDVKKEDFTLEKNSENEENHEIAETRDDLIEEAIEKHVKKEPSLKEADEYTIIDRVINQKKKGKWRKIK